MNTIQPIQFVSSQDLKATEPKVEVVLNRTNGSAPSPEFQKKQSEVKNPSAHENGNSLQKQLQQKTDDLNQRLQQSQSELRFEIDEQSERMVIKVLDIQKGEVVKQFPSEAFLAQSARIKEFLQQSQDSKLGGVDAGFTQKIDLGIFLSEKI